MRFINNLHKYDTIDDIYYCRDAEVCSAKNGSKYVKMELVDKTGSIKAFRWNSDNQFAAKVNEQYIKVIGAVTEYNDVLNINVNSIKIVDKNTVNAEDFVMSTKWDKDSMIEKILGLVNYVNNDSYRKLLLSFFTDDEFLKKFKNSTAAKSMHHNYNGGLLEHTLWVATICSNLEHQYSNLNRDLLITASLLHDIGKVVEFTDGPDYKYTFEGELLGHIVIGILMIHDRARDIEGFSQEDLIKLEHCIASHHGKLEYGSPKIPALIEAMILSTVDGLDANVFMAEDLIEKSAGADEWTPYSQKLGTRMHKG